MASARVAQPRSASAFASGSFMNQPDVSAFGAFDEYSDLGPLYDQGSFAAAGIASTPTPSPPIFTSRRTASLGSRRSGSLKTAAPVLGAAAATATTADAALLARLAARMSAQQSVPLSGPAASVGTGAGGETKRVYAPRSVLLSATQRFPVPLASSLNATRVPASSPFPSNAEPFVVLAQSRTGRAEPAAPPAAVARSTLTRQQQEYKNAPQMSSEKLGGLDKQRFDALAQTTTVDRERLVELLDLQIKESLPFDIGMQLRKIIEQTVNGLEPGLAENALWLFQVVPPMQAGSPQLFQGEQVRYAWNSLARLMTLAGVSLSDIAKTRAIELRG